MPMGRRRRRLDLDPLDPNGFPSGTPPALPMVQTPAPEGHRDALHPIPGRRLDRSSPRRFPSSQPGPVLLVRLLLGGLHLGRGGSGSQLFQLEWCRGRGKFVLARGGVGRWGIVHLPGRRLDQQPVFPTGSIPGLRRLRQGLPPLRPLPAAANLLGPRLQGLLMGPILVRSLVGPRGVGLLPLPGGSAHPCGHILGFTLVGVLHQALGRVLECLEQLGLGPLGGEGVGLCLRPPLPVPGSPGVHRGSLPPVRCGQDLHAGRRHPLQGGALGLLCHRGPGRPSGGGGECPGAGAPGAGPGGGSGSDGPGCPRQGRPGAEPGNHLPPWGGP